MTTPSAAPGPQVVEDAGGASDASSDAAAFAADDAGPDDGGADAGNASADDAGADAGEPAPCPDPAMARIGRFCIDKWEAHLVAPDEDGGLAPLPYNERPPAGVAYQARAAAGCFPQAYISRVEAKAACKAAGKRLCSMREWRRACQGKRGFHYPYGTKGEKGRCNTGKAHLLSQFYGRDARHWTYEDFNNPLLDKEEGYLAKSGDYDRCESESGVFDLPGNLHEWVSDTVEEAFVERLEHDEVERVKQPWKFGNGVFVGGFFSTTDQHGPGCLFTTFAHEPTYHDYSIGFRCCANATVADEPEKKKKRP